MPFSRKSLNLLSAAFLLIGGLALIVTGAWFAIDNARFIDGAHRAHGIVEDVVGRRGARGQMLYYPVVRYRPAGGDEIVFTAKSGLWPSPFNVGDPVTVAYQPTGSDNAKIVSFWMLWFLPGAVLIFGIGGVFAGWHTLKKVI